MEKEVIRTDKAPAAIGPYSQGIAASPFLFVSGQLGLDPVSGELAGRDLDAQARQALDNLREIVRAGGGDLNDVTAVDVYLTDMSKFAEFNAIYAEYFVAHKPARAVVQVCALPKGACVEIKCIVVIKK